jgi:hypothetical protein
VKTTDFALATPLDVYFVLAGADDQGAEVESDEGNDCKASATTVTITQ